MLIKLIRHVNQLYVGASLIFGVKKVGGLNLALNRTAPINSFKLIVDNNINN